MAVREGAGATAKFLPGREAGGAGRGRSPELQAALSQFDHSMSRLWPISLAGPYSEGGDAVPRLLGESECRFSAFRGVRVPQLKSGDDYAALRIPLWAPAIQGRSGEIAMPK